MLLSFKSRGISLRVDQYVAIVKVFELVVRIRNKPIRFEVRVFNDQKIFIVIEIAVDLMQALCPHDLLSRAILFVMPEKPISFDGCFVIGDNLKSLFYLHSKFRAKLQLSVDQGKIIRLVLPFKDEERIVLE